MNAKKNLKHTRSDAFSVDLAEAPEKLPGLVIAGAVHYIPLIPLTTMCVFMSTTVD